MGPEIVLMAIGNDHYYGLDSVAADIWKRMATPSRVDALCSALAAEYDATPDSIQADVLDLLSRLAEYGVIEIRS
jgi:hypothetical protein